MSLAKEIETLIDDIGRGLTESAIRNRLLALQERAEALDTALKKGDAALTECNSALHDACSDLERLKADAQGKKLVSDKNTVTDIGKKLLQCIVAARGDASLDDIASALSIEWSDAKYHADLLAKNGKIRLQKRVRGHGRYSQTWWLCTITDEGIAYVVENKLV